MCCTSTLLYFHKAFLLLYRGTANTFSCSSSILAELPIECRRFQWRERRLRLPNGVTRFTGHWRYTATSLPCPPFCPQRFVSDAVAAKVACSTPCSHLYFMIVLIALKVLHSPQVTGARSDRAGALLWSQCVRVHTCVRQPRI